MTSWNGFRPDYGKSLQVCWVQVFKARTLKLCSVAFTICISSRVYKKYSYQLPWCFKGRVESTPPGWKRSSEPLHVIGLKQMFLYSFTVFSNIMLWRLYPSSSLPASSSAAWPSLWSTHPKKTFVSLILPTFSAVYLACLLLPQIILLEHVQQQQGVLDWPAPLTCLRYRIIHPHLGK